MDQIRFQNLLLRIRATREAIEIYKEGAAPEPLYLRLPDAKWKAVLLGKDGTPQREARLRKRASDGAFGLNWGAGAAVRLTW